MLDSWYANGFLSKEIWKCLYFFQTFDQFEYDGCENCEEYLHMKKNRDAVYECTSSSFDGYGWQVANVLQFYFMTIVVETFHKVDNMDQL